MRIIVSLAFGILCNSAFALSYSTPERSTVNSISFTIDGFHTINGRYPTDWSDLEQPGDRPLDEYFKESKPTKRYAFVKNRFRLPLPLEGQILIITRRPSYETTLSEGFLGYKTGLKGPGRYIIYRRDSGDVHASWVTEDYVNRAFSAAKEPLPVPDTEADPIWISKARFAVYVRRGFYILLGIGALFLVARLIRWSSKKTEQDAAANP